MTELDKELSEVSGGAANGNIISYSIVYGDTLYEIAQRFGTTVKDICELNRIANPDKIKAGDTIKVHNNKNIIGWL